MAGTASELFLTECPTRGLSSPVVDASLKAFAEHQRRRNLRGTTILGRQRTLQTLERWLAPSRLTDATPGDLEQWLDDCDLSPASRNTYTGMVVAFYRWAVDVALIDSDPSAKLERPRLPRRLPRPMPMDRLRDALDAADPRMRAWLLLAGFEGLRCFEIAGLRREDVRETDRPPTLFVSDGKGGHERILPLHPLVADALRPFTAARRGWLWTSSKSGQPFRAGTVSSYIANHLHIHGFAETAHQARHTFGTEMYRISHDLRMVQELMGHSDPKTTAGYTLLDTRTSTDAVNLLTFDDV